MWRTFVGSPLTLAVKLDNFTALHRKIMYKIVVEKTTFLRLSYIFSNFSSTRAVSFSKGLIKMPLAEKFKY